jgi:phosphatidylinositol alpha-1,6-mannosyltransferase
MSANHRSDLHDPRRVLLVTNDLGPRAGGIESFILGLLGELDGSQIAIFTSSQDGDRAFDEELRQKYGVVVYRDRAKVLLPTPRINRVVRTIMKRHSSSIIWYGAAAPLGWMSGCLKRAGAKRQVSLTHGHEVWWSKLWPFTWIMRSIARNLDVITYLGDFTHNALKPILGKRVQAVRIAPGIALDHFTPGPKSQELIDALSLREKAVIVCVGRLVHRKGQDRLIEAMPEILQSVPKAVLLIVGEGPYREHLDSLVKKYSLSESVRFVGRLKYNDLPIYLRLGDIFAMPSRSRLAGLEVEGLGIVYLEASAAGLPVIGGASGGAPDAVLDGVTGLVVDGTKTHDIAKATVSLLQDPEGARTMGARGREWVVDQWSWKLWGERFSEVLFGEKP